MDAKEFKKRFNEGKSWADAENACRALTDTQRAALRDALAMTDEYTGLDMRQEFFLMELRALTKVVQ